MSQNTSSAVMQQRSEPNDSLDDFPTTPWATRAVLEWLHNNRLIQQEQICREPAANRGYMVRPLQEYFLNVEASDVHDYGAGYPVKDYLWADDPEMVDWTFCNPPFRLAQQFIERAIRTSRVGVAMIVRSAFMEDVGRHRDLFTPYPPAYVLQHVERVPMVKGRYDPKISSATSYSWIVWLADSDSDTRLRWIAPCRKRLERASDCGEAA